MEFFLSFFTNSLSCPILKLLYPTLAEPILTEPILAEPILAEPILTEPILTEHTPTQPKFCVGRLNCIFFKSLKLLIVFS
jgi:hypothetical protein